MGPRWDVHLHWWLGCPWRRVGRELAETGKAVRLWHMSNFWRRKGGKEGSYIGKVLRLQWSSRSSKTISARPVVSPWARVTCQRSPGRWALVNRRPCCWTSVSHRDHSARVHHASCVVTKEGPCTWLSHCVCRWFSASSITDVFWWWWTYDAEICTLCMLPCVSPRPLHQIALSLIFQPFSFQASNWMVKPLATSWSLMYSINGLTLGHFFHTKSSALLCCSIHWKNVPSPPWTYLLLHRYHPSSFCT